MWRLLGGGLAVLASRIAMAGPTGLNRPWPRLAFAARKLEEAQAHLFGLRKPQESAQITLDIPDLAEDGAVVPVSVFTSLPEVDSIALLAEKNPNPLLAQFLLSPRLEPFVSTHVKLGGSGAVLALVRSKGRVYVARKTVKVTVGGCG